MSTVAVSIGTTHLPHLESGQKLRRIFSQALTRFDLGGKQLMPKRRLALGYQ